MNWKCLVCGRIPENEFVGVEELSAQYGHMRGLPIKPYDGQPQLLNGTNNIHSFATLEANVVTPMEPIAVRTNHGWAVYGPNQSTMVVAGNNLGYLQLSNQSIKSQLPTGPDMLVPLIEALHGFRERRITFGKDMKEKFHQLKIRALKKQKQRIICGKCRKIHQAFTS